MKHFTVLVFAVAMLACRKSTAPVIPNGNDYTIPPAATPVTTNVQLYVINNIQAQHPMIFHADNGLYLSYNNTFDAFQLPRGTTDAFLSGLQIPEAFSGPLYNLFTTFTSLGADKTYVSFKLPEMASGGDILYDYTPGVIDLPNNGKLTVPAYGFGHHDGLITFGVYALYLHPTIADYAISLPCYPAADHDGKRDYLQSYGCYYLAPHSINVEFNPDVDVELSMPIQPSQLAHAPDSIATWWLNGSGTWQAAGFAKRNGNAYTKQITSRGYWNFAVPRSGVYLTVHLQSDQQVALVNTRFVLKGTDGEVADARTDSNGDALVFVPTGDALTLDVINDHFNAWYTAPQPPLPVGTFHAAGETTVTLPARPDIVTITGHAFDCAGQPISSGAVMLLDAGAKDNYVFPVHDGKFAISAWIERAYNSAQLALLDQGGQPTAMTTVVLGSILSQDEPKTYDLQLFSCVDASPLYASYRLDSTPIMLTGNTAANTLVENDNPPGVDVITIGDATKGIRFQGSFNTVMGNQFFSSHLVDLPTGLQVNGADCTFEPYSEIVITRQDGVPGGIAEGWFSIHYKDPNGHAHAIAGNFRVKRV